MATTIGANSYYIRFTIILEATSCIKVAILIFKANLHYIKFTITLATTSCIRVVTVGAYSNYIKFSITTTTSCDIKVVVIGTNINTSSNNYTTINKNIKRTTTNFAYNKKSNIDSI
jgi:hypothetical protein